MIIYVCMALTILAIIFSWYFIWTDSYSDGLGDSIFSTFMATFFIGCVGALVTVIVVLPVSSFADDSYKYSGTDNLVAIDMDKGTKGQFFLGSGYIDSKLQYSYYATDGDSDSKNYYARSIDAENATIIETDDERPSVKSVDACEPSWLVPSWAGPCTLDHYEVRVPKGSIKPMIDMSLPGVDKAQQD